MAARASRSASRKARATEAVATGPLGALSHDELGVIFDGLADPLQPVVAVALSSTCLGLRTPLREALKVLQARHEKAKALCRKMQTSCAALRVAENLDLFEKSLNADDMSTLGMILRTNGLPWLEQLVLANHNGRGVGDAGMQALCEGLGSGAALSLATFDLAFNEIGPAGAAAFAAAVSRGAMPKLDFLFLNDNPIGNQGVAALAAPLRRLPALCLLDLGLCGIGDEAVASLFADLGKDDFKQLKNVDLNSNHVTDKGCDTLVAAIDSIAQPLIELVNVMESTPASGAAQQSVQDAVDRAVARRAASRAADASVDASQ